MPALRAEIIAIGDEMVSGQRLDTNSQWLSRELADLGLEPRFHTTVGDDLDDGIAAFRTAIERVDFVISTGGIGPTKDDLTRQVLAAVAQVELRFHPQVVDHIKEIFRRYDREMPENNTVQAWFPDGATIIANREGTAPGIDLLIPVEGRPVRLFALPGVPYEMKEMWSDHVRPAIQAKIGKSLAIVHHVVNCFGAGESQIEMLLDELTARGREPRVGITASQATISLRITATGPDEAQCRASIESVTAVIRDRLGNLVFADNDVALEDVVGAMLASQRQTIALVDYGFGGVASQLLSQSSQGLEIHAGCIVLPPGQLSQWLLQPTTADDSAAAAARQVRSILDATLGVAIGPPRQVADKLLPEYELAIATANSCRSWRLSHGGHSGLRASRTSKQILNQIRLFLMGVTDAVAGSGLEKTS